MNEVLLDTNAAIALFKQDVKLTSYVEQKSVLVPIIAIAELLYGAERSTKRDENIQKINTFAEKRKILPCTIETAHWYGKIMGNLRAKGRPIPQNDVWIASIALQYDLILLTQDKHFDNVDDLRTQNW